MLVGVVLIDRLAFTTKKKKGRKIVLLFYIIIDSGKKFDYFCLIF